MNVGGEGHWRDIYARNWDKEATACRYSVTSTMEYLQFLVSELPAMANALLGEAESFGYDSQLLSTLTDKLTERCESLKKRYVTAMV
jgi:hypothetical protein